MWITGEVELPDAILDAHAKGELVFFVGAGASLDSPSRLPTFQQLAMQLAQRASHSEPKEDEPLDYFIGKLESQDFDAHQHTREIISDSTSRPNSLHATIVDLANSGEKFRVVTTNYDNHLSEAARSQGITIPDMWYSPALPLGHDFTGLVHLHGSVKRRKEEMVLTDQDFGHAYLTDAWATRFLTSMFNRFTVVFIGYSHDDTIMQYLARGLPSDSKGNTGNTSKRYIFTSRPSGENARNLLDEKWNYLGVEPIVYPVIDKDHSVLVRALKTWADRVRLGRAEHRARVREIVVGGIEMSPDDRDYIRKQLQTETGTKDFHEATRSLLDSQKVEWLRWVEEIPEFKALFSSNASTNESYYLAQWFVDIFIESPTLNGFALQTVQRFGQKMSSILYREMCIGAYRLQEEDNASSKLWKTLLATSIYGQSIQRDSLDFLYADASNSEVCVLPLLRTILRPFLKLEVDFISEQLTGNDIAEQEIKLPNASVSWLLEESELTEQVKLAVSVAAPGDKALGGLLEGALLEAYELLAVYYGDRLFDPLSFHRSAIEPHPQDSRRKPVDAIIDGLRDYGVKTLLQWQNLPDRWWNFEYPLMRRLALHLITIDQERNSDQKITWLLDRTGLYVSAFKHEIYQLLRESVPSASLVQKQKVLEAVLLGPDYPEERDDYDRKAAYAKYNLLAWLKQSDPKWSEVIAEFDAIQVANSNFAVREHPDLDMWMESGVRTEKLPFSIDEFIGKVEENAQNAVENLVAYDYSPFSLNSPRWEDAILLVKKLAQQRPDLAITLWDKLGERTDIAEPQKELYNAIIEGWSESDLGNSVDDAIEHLNSLVVDKDYAHMIGYFLRQQILQWIDATESATLAVMRKLARALWDEHSTEFTYSYKDSVSALTFAPLYLNSWPGFLAQYWISEVDRRWRSERDSWFGLNDEELDALVAFLNASSDALDATQPAIAQQLYFLYGADKGFTTDHVLPLFDDAERHAYAWYPFLHNARWNDSLLEAGLFDTMVTELDRLGELPEEMIRNTFLELVVAVVSYAGITDDERRGLLDRTIFASNGQYANQFAQAVIHFLAREDVDGVEIWQQWLGEHVRRRLAGMPRNASLAELSCWADAVPFVGRFIPKAIALFGVRNIGFSEMSSFLNIPNQALNSYGEQLVEFLSKRIRSTTKTGVVIDWELQELTKMVKNVVGDDIARPMVDALIEKDLKW